MVLGPCLFCYAADVPWRFEFLRLKNTKAAQLFTAIKNIAGKIYKEKETLLNSRECSE